jgi:YVTN family beta-propeller protein
MRVKSAIAVVATAATALVATASSPAYAYDQPLVVIASTPVPTSGYSDLVLHVPTGQTFVSGGRDGSGIIVTDRDGQIIESIAGQSGASGMTLSADGSTLYAALTPAGSISVIDTATRTERARYVVGDNTCPYDVAVTGGKLWFSYGCVGVDNGRIGSVDISNPAAPVALDQAGLWAYAPRLEGAAAGHLLFVVEESVFPNVLASFDVSGAQPVRRTALEQVTSVNQFAVTPDGSTIIAATPGEYQFTSKVAAYSTADMSEIVRYAAHGPVVSIAIAPDGRIATSSSDWGLDMFVPGEIAPRWTVYQNFTPGLDPAPRGLAVGGDGRLYLASNFGGSTALTVLDPTPVETSFIFDNVPFPIRVGRSVTFQGTLATSDGSATGVRTIHVTRQDPRGTTTLPDVQTAVDGTFSVKDRPRTMGETVWTFTFDGTDRQLPTTYTITVPVSR